VLDSGSRAATTTFAQRGIGDVLVSWENEAYLARESLAAGSVEIVVPSVSILAEPPVTVVDRVALRKGTREVADAYLKFLYTPVAQEIIARNYYRPRDPTVAAKYAARFPKVNLVTIAELGGWTKVHRVHFAEKALFDQIYLSR
jgi:sulfate transport system substrate-binding protein